MPSRLTSWSALRIFALMSLVALSMAKAAIIIFFALQSNFLVLSECKQYYGATHQERLQYYSSPKSHVVVVQGRASGGQLLQAAPAPVGNGADNIRLVCSATRYASSCVNALLRDERALNASPQDMVERLTNIAMKRSQAAVADAQTLATLIAPTASNMMNLTSVATGCTELLDLAAYFVHNSHVAFAAGNMWEDIQAWLSGALTQSNDCYYALVRFCAATALSSSSTSSQAALLFVTEMTKRLNTTVELISNALALTGANLAYGPDATLWKPPPESRVEQLRRLATDVASSFTESRFPHWMADADRVLLLNAQPTTAAARVTQETRDQWQVAKAANVTVALDSMALQYNSIQVAVNEAPSWSPTRYVIYIEAGVYNETVRIPKHKINLMFLGDGSNVTIITGNLHVQTPGNITTWLSATVAVTGEGFMARGVTFENTAGPEQHQAVALRVESDRSAFQACSILGHQDSLYTHSLRQFYKDCTIAGTVDFIFGNSAAVFQTCNIVVRVRNLTTTMAGGSTTSTLTAQGRIDPGQNTALVFQNCSVDGTAEYDAVYQADPTRHHVYLGRPWRSFSRTVFIDTSLSQILHPQGWSPWNGSFALDTLLDAEYGSYGPGAFNLTQRISWSTQLSFQQAQHFSAQRLLQADAWLPATAIP